MKKFSKDLRKVFRLTRFLHVDWFNSFRINSKLPFRQFIKFPILVYNCKLSMDSHSKSKRPKTNLVI